MSCASTAGALLQRAGQWLNKKPSRSYVLAPQYPNLHPTPVSVGAKTTSSCLEYVWRVSKMLPQSTLAFRDLLLLSHLHTFNPSN